MAQKANGSWSPSLSIGMSGIGWGFIMGASLKEIVYLIRDARILRTMAGNMGMKLGTHTKATLVTNFVSN